MAQRPKEHMRRAILSAAAQEFADAGYERAALAKIAADAGTSIGNLYKYFASKDDLFAAAIPQRVVRELGLLLRRRVEALGGERDADALSPEHPYRLVSAELLSFAHEHRAQILFVLRHAEGTVYAAAAEELVQSLTMLALGYAKRAYRHAKMTRSRRRALVRIYRAFLVSIASILDEETTERALRETTAQLTTYHLAGLRAFFADAERTSRRNHS